MFVPGHAAPHKGCITTAQPIFAVEKIEQIRQNLRDPRHRAMFTLGVNSALRAGDILGLKHSDLREVEGGRIEILIKEEKTGKLKRFVLNEQTSAVLRDYASTVTDRERIFDGCRGKTSVSYFSRLIKKWTADVGLTGRHSTHTLRKSFTAVHYKRGTPLSVLMKCLNHGSESQTLRYLGLVEADVDAVYADFV